MEKEDENYSEGAESGMVDYAIPPQHLHHHHHQQMFVEPTRVDTMNIESFADAMQFADFGPKLGLLEQDGNPNNSFLKFPVLSNQKVLYDQDEGNSNADIYGHPGQVEFMGNVAGNNNSNEENNIVENNSGADDKKTTKRKRPRSVKTTEEVESQRMTHIAVERNRRKQMNEHLRVLRALMPSSYVQRGDQASIIGGAIEFVRELEQLLQCLESQKRRRLYGDQVGPSSPPQGFQPPPLHETQYHDDQLRLVEVDPANFNAGLIWEESAESKSSIADVEVKMSGLNALIKILSRRRPGQLIKIIADLEELNFTILHTNITTIEQTVLYSINVQVSTEARFTAEDIATSIHQIFTFIHAN